MKMIKLFNYLCYGGGLGGGYGGGGYGGFGGGYGGGGYAAAASNQASASARKEGKAAIESKEGESGEKKKKA